jgi:hypothetical protein
MRQQPSRAPPHPRLLWPVARASGASPYSNRFLGSISGVEDHPTYFGGLAWFWVSHAHNLGGRTFHPGICRVQGNLATSLGPLLCILGCQTTLVCSPPGGSASAAAGRRCTLPAPPPPAAGRSRRQLDNVCDAGKSDFHSLIVFLSTSDTTLLPCPESCRRILTPCWRSRPALVGSVCP